MTQLDPPKKPTDAQAPGRIEVSETTPERMGLALTTLDCGAFEIDFVNRTFWCSPDFVRLTGRAMTAEEVFGPIWPIHHPDDAPRLRAEIEELARVRAREVKIETRVVLPDGGFRWIEWRIKGLFDGDRLIGSLGLAFDIDARKRQEAELVEARRVLQANADRLSVAIKAARAAVFDLDVENRTCWFSPEVEALAGRPLAYEDICRPAWSICHPDDAERVSASVMMAEGGTLAPVQWRLIRASGEVRWVESNGEVIFKPDGGVRRVIGVVVDIDERKRQEAALLDSRREAQANAERLKLAMMASRAGVFEIDFEAESFWCSPDFEEVVGQKLGFQDVRQPVWPIIHPEDRPRVLDTLIGMDGVLMPSVQWRVMLPDGRERWVESNGLIYRNAEGRAQRITGTVIDIDERKRQQLKLDEARAALQVNAERLKLALDAAQAGIFETNAVDRTFWCSPEFERIVGRSLSVEEAMDLWPMIHPDDRPRIQALMDECRRSRAFTVELEMRVVLPSGQTRWIDGHILMHRDDEGGLVKMIGLVFDAEERKRQELNLIEAERAASAAAEAKSQFLANMSHEIRTPMNGVLGILNVLGREELSDEARRLVAEAEGCGAMLAQLLNDVIDFSRIEAGRLTLSPEATDAAAVLSSVGELMRPQAEAKGVELKVEVTGGDGWVMIDPVRLRQALFNLIGNAIKFTPEGRVEARLSIREADAGCKRLRFEIHDTGVGIPAAAQSKLFQRFQQADGSTAREFGGSGLGLVITRALAEMMGGEVGFTSAEGRGSTFWIDVPAPAAGGAGAAAAQSLPGLHGMRLLVVEDNATNRLVATKILEALGAEVATAEDGLLGVEAVQRAQFDLVLMDVQMPRMDGVEATRAIRALPGPQRDIPIVGLTANVLLHQWQAYRDAGMNGVAAKPISPSALLEEIARVLNGDAAGPRAELEAPDEPERLSHEAFQPLHRLGDHLHVPSVGEAQGMAAPRRIEIDAGGDRHPRRLQ